MDGFVTDTILYVADVFGKRQARSEMEQPFSCNNWVVWSLSSTSNPKDSPAVVWAYL
jgi:hypothetical protein